MRNSTGCVVFVAEGGDCQLRFLSHKILPGAPLLVRSASCESGGGQRHERATLGSVLVGSCNAGASLVQVLVSCFSA